MSSAEQQLRRRHAAAAAEGRTIRAYESTFFSGLCSSDRTAWRREYKRKQRQKAAVKVGRLYIPRKRNRLLQPDAHVVLYMLHQKETQLHDAHVRRYQRLNKDRDRAADRYRSNPQKDLSRKKAKRVAIHDSYVLIKLQQMGVPCAEATPEIINLKREQIALRRLARELKTSAKKQLKEHHEGITKHS